MAQMTLRPSLASQALKIAIQTKQPIFVWGSPGIGKSQGVVAGTVAELGMKLIDIRAVLLDPVDLRGLPTVEDGLAIWAIPGWLPREGCEPTVVFVDELTRAPMLVQNAFFQLILDRKLGEYTLPDNCAIVGAGNNESDGAGITKMSPALANRFIHINVVPDLDDWCRWATKAAIEPVVIAFLRFKSDLLHKFDKNEHAFPTPRSWAFVSRIIAGGGDKDVERALVAGAVGDGAMVDFMSFVELFRSLPSIDAILLDPENAKVPTQMGVLYAVSAAMGHRAKPENFARVMTYVNRLPTEFAVFAVRDAVVRDPDLAKTSEFTKWAVKNSHLL